MRAPSWCREVGTASLPSGRLREQWSLYRSGLHISDTNGPPLVASIHVLSKEPSHQLCDAVAILL